MGLFFGPLGKTFLERGLKYTSWGRCMLSLGQWEIFLLFLLIFDDSMALFGVRRGPEMIVCHRAPSSLNMNSYRAIWTHFRPIFMIFIDLILQTGKAAGIWASCLDPRPIFNDFLKTKKMCNVRTINLAVVSSHIEPYGPISDQISRRRRRRRRRRTNPQIPT